MGSLRYTLLFWGFILNSSLAHANALAKPYCIQDNNNRSIPSPNMFNSDDETLKKLEVFKSKIENLDEEAKLLKSNTLTTDAPLAKNSISAEEQARLLQEIKQDVKKLVIELSSTHRWAAKELLKYYFSYAFNTTFMKFLGAPKSVDIELASSAIALELPISVMRDVFPFGDSMIDGIDARIVKGHETAAFRLTISKNNLYRQLVKAVALSNETQKDGSNHLETIRCTLTHLLANKLSENNIMLNDTPFDLTTLTHGRVCSATTTATLANIAKDEQNPDSELKKRIQLQELLPNIPSRFTNPQVQDAALKIIASRTNPALAYAFNNQLIFVNSNIGQDNPLTIDELSQFQNELRSEINKIYENNAVLMSLRNILGREEILNQTMQLLNNCSFIFKDYLHQELSREQLHRALISLDEYYFLVLLNSTISSVYDIISEFNEAQLIIYLKEYALHTRAKATELAIITSAKAFSQIKSTPNDDEIESLVSKTLGPQIQKVVRSVYNKGELESWANDIVQKLKSPEHETNRLTTLRQKYAQLLIQVSQKISDIKNPIKNPSTLTFDFTSMSKTIAPMIDTLSDKYARQMRVIIKLEPSGGHKEAWKIVARNLENDINTAGASCVATGIFTYLSRAAIGIFNSKSAAQERMRQDCLTLKVISRALALDEEEEPQNLEKIISNLSEVQDNDSLAELLNRYRNKLADTLFGEFPILYSKSLETGGNDRQLFNDLATIDENGNLSDAIRIIGMHVKKSQSFTARLFKKTIKAGKLEDLKQLIISSSVINDLLGADAQQQRDSQLSGDIAFNDDIEIVETLTEGYVFPQLINKHEKLQLEWSRKKSDREFYQDQMVDRMTWLSLIPLGIQVGRWGLSYSSRPLFRSLTAQFSKAHMRLFNFNSASSRLVGALFLGQVANLQYRINNFKADSNYAKKLIGLDILEPSTADNPLPMLKWNHFRNYETLLNNKIDNSQTDLYWYAGFSVLTPIIYATVLAGSPSYMRYTSRLYKSRSADILRASAQQRLAIIESEKLIIARDIRKLKNELDFFKFDHIPDHSKLMSELRRIQLNPKLSAQYKKLANEYADNIVQTVAERVQKYGEHGEVLDIMSRAFFGPHGKAQDAVWYIKDLDRVYKLRGAPGHYNGGIL